MSAPNKEVLIIASEASSALYAQRLLEHWQKSDPAIKAFGVGDQAMETLGFERLGQAEEMAVVGFKEVLSHWGLIKDVFDSIVEEAQKRKPAFALLLDYPGFNLRLAKKLKELNISVIYYISPQLWAWKKGRIKQVQQYVDKMLVLFPFEKEFYEENNVEVEFVGHPLLDELDPELFSEEKRKEQRNRCGIGDDEVVVGLMPGSRNSELDHNLKRQVDVARKLYLDNKDKSLRFALFVAPSLTREQVQERLGDLDFPLLVIQDDPFVMIRMADLILTASGTATIFVGLMKKPMIIMYIMNTMTAFIARRLVTSTPFFGMVNIILGKEVGREFFQEKANVNELSSALQNFIDHPEERKKTEEELSKLHDLLGDKGATVRVANALEPYFGGEL